MNGGGESRKFLPHRGSPPRASGRVDTAVPGYKDRTLGSYSLAAERGHR
jgi:hypothetical protein